jgi:hypothetical protein
VVQTDHIPPADDGRGVNDESNPENNIF